MLSYAVNAYEKTVQGNFSTGDGLIISDSIPFVYEQFRMAFDSAKFDSACAGQDAEAVVS